MEVQVEYEYVAQEADELSLRKGDIITNVVQKLDGWWEGTLGSKRGLFPDNFVKVVGSESKSIKEDDEVFTETVQLRKKPIARKLRALFSYSPEQDDELKLDVGDIVDFLAEVEDGWWKGSLKGKTGIFPSNFVEDTATPTTNGTSLTPEPNKHNENRATYVLKGTPDIPSVADTTNIEEEPAPPIPPKPVRELARCFYPYAAQNEDELELQEGDMVTIISKNCEDEGWWRGELRGKTGLFPDNFVRIISPPNESQTSTTATTANTSAKITAQGDSPPPKHAPPPPPTSDTPDGAASSKGGSKDMVNRRTPSRDVPAVPPPPKSMTPTSPMSPANIGFSYLSSLKPTGKKDLLIKKEALGSSVDDSSLGNEVGEFNAVERNEKQLNHLTAKRAKAPKRRPPSTLLTRENEHEGENGVGASPTSSIESPQQNVSLIASLNGGSPIGNNSSGISSGGFNATPSTNVSSDVSNLSTPGSRLSQSREMDNNNTSSSSLNTTGTPTSITPQSAKPKVLPWMQELRQNQEKKRLATSPNPPVVNNSPVSGVTNSGIPLPATNATTSPSPTGLFTPSPVLKPKDREPSANLPPAVPAKAPPLPAKPVIPPEKTFPTPPSANVSQSSSASPTNSATSTVSTVSMKFGRKTPTTVAATANSNNYINTVITTTNTNSTNAVTNNTSNSNHVLASHTNNTNDVANANSTTDIIIPNASKRGVNNPEFVSQEEYAKLKDRVHFLESELDVVKKQLKLLLDRDLSKGHIV